MDRRKAGDGQARGRQMADDRSMTVSNLLRLHVITSDKWVNTRGSISSKNYLTEKQISSV